MGGIGGEDTRQRILAAAVEVFAEFGFRGGTIREIVERAQVNQAAVNYHFHSKDRLYQETFGFAFMQAIGQPQGVPIVPLSATPEEQVRRLIAALLSGTDRRDIRTQLSRLLAWEMLSPSGVLERVKQADVLPHFKTICGMVRHFFSDQTTPFVVSATALWLVGQCLVFQRGIELLQELYPDLAVTQVASEELIHLVTHLALNGLKNGPHES
ncbi:MAG: TetR/AcrR family transcriptional regulator [Nitrospira sp.]|nr:TetR/AcrR family transcriptional regulator [Nitrospira sp.]